MISVESGAKGSLFNVCQMTGLLRQQYVNGKRLTDGRPQRTIFDQGFVIGSFGSGLSAQEFFSHARAGRTSFCDTALTTSQAGCSQRKLIKLMGKMVVHNDRRMRCVCSKRIYKEVFGRDGIDPCKRVLCPHWLKRAIHRIKFARAEDCQGKTEKTTRVIWMAWAFTTLCPCCSLLSCRRSTEDKDRTRKLSINHGNAS